MTWGVDVQAAKGRYLFTVPNTSFHTNSIPSMDVDRSGGFYTGALYICLACDKARGTLSDVYVTHSYDGGVTWTKLFMVNDFPGNSQFFPALQVDPGGHVNVGWMDRRDDLADVAINYYCSRSDDGGLTWEANTRLSDASFDPNSYPQGGYLGDYSGIAASERMVYAMDDRPERRLTSPSIRSNLGRMTSGDLGRHRRTPELHADAGSPSPWQHLAR